MTLIKNDEPMYRHTTFRIGGPARLFLLPESERELASLLDEYPDAFILGGGSNLLVSDEGLDTVISLKRLNSISHKKTSDEISLVTAQAGLGLTALARRVRRMGLRGLEFAFGIPGTVGGAVVMNAGGFGGEVRNTLESARLLIKGRFKKFGVEKLGLAYRSNNLPEGAVVVSATFRLETGDKDAIYSRMKEIFEQRQKKQPLDNPSAGSIFKNPPGKFAGKIIEDMGFKGMRIGEAQVSGIHANFIVNRGKATAKQVAELIEKLESEAVEKTNIKFQREIKFAGRFHL
ncbi:MAG: UDP-N-acetylenolpyruvoylglucosamine reductase [bacterium]|nr:MAG: UDP-N-acetylenolpyruvoylglucosamine reductase [bacterium]